MTADDTPKEQFGTETIVGVNEFVKAPNPLDSESHRAVDMIEKQGELTGFKIRLADTMGRRASAGLLINKMYAWRGYSTASPVDNILPNRITLIASNADKTIGTISVGFDSNVGLLVDQLYKDEIDQLRARGSAVCEFTKLAVDGAIRSKRVLASMFHIAHIFSHRVRGCSDLLIEVNPRHVKFYERMLGFRQLGEERNNPRVNAPAVLLWLQLSYAHEQIQKFGGKSELATIEKSLYPFFFSPSEENGIVGRLQRMT